MSKIPLTVACWDYDRTRALFDGRVRIEGCDANFLGLPVEETFLRALKSAEFDVAELSLSSYSMLHSKGQCPYIAIPVFLSRMFRHSAIYVRSDRGIDKPSDLIGRRIGVPEYQLTAPVWVRGMLQSEYGVKPSDIQWVTGGVEQSGRKEKVALKLPDDIRIGPIEAGATLSDALAKGELDGIIAPRKPSCFGPGKPGVKRLFADYKAAEQAYYGKTGIFPIMHVVGIRRELAEKHPWLPSSVLKAFVQSKDHVLADLAEVAALKATLPWLNEAYEEAVQLFGSDYWSYGLNKNKMVLDAFLEYHHSQGLSVKRLQAEELFHPATLEQYLL